ncbi:DNA primase [Paremcibacter congregatus]|uniref:DNA primase n=1 Tax=Paremcibacter congregatus TaxID=2043170 RepID=A0A2G4YRA9_9PROT|nr:DNA primase [Paremcibacter congregatus]PHZ84861.1 DNA primase [Paremcibacter congregatus]QDE26165.1 DNA primase [Paremcibacter congregatus]
MGFTPDFLDEIRNRIPVSDIVGRRVKLTRKGREHGGLCPFHNEKTPSFTVNDDKGFYHCFGCGAHGDVIKFISETEGLSFPETVERLAEQAGLALPDYSPEDKEKASQKKSLYEVMETAAKWFETQLVSQAGTEGRDYFDRRGLTAATIKTFRLGFSPEGRTALKDALLSRDGITEDMMVEAGLLIRPEAEGGDPRPSYDRFRHRVMFPITDRQGRVVAFGGRALNKNAKAKYLNSPETPLFHKGRLLYNLAGARKAAYDEGRVLVAEGYMDVIAMAQAGFTNAVAPLGTAVTEEQVLELWKLAPEPLMCFDGDKAGVRAAYRVAERTLPLLKAGHSLRFVHLPTDEDPDSYLSGQGEAAFRELLEQGRPLVDLLWEMKTQGVDSDTPEQRAGLEQSLSETLGDIKDKTIRGYYDKAFQERLIKLLGNAFVPDHSLADMGTSRRPGPMHHHTDQRSSRDSGQRSSERYAQRPAERPAQRPSSASYKKNQSAYGAKAYGKKNKYGASEELPGVKRLQDTGIFRASEMASTKRERLLILTVLNHPWLLKKHDEEFATTIFESAELDKLRGEIIDVCHRESDLENERLYSHLERKGFGKALEVIFKQGEFKAEWFAWPGAAPEDVEQGWFHVVNRYRRVSDLEKELKAAELELAENMTEEVYARFLALKAELENAKGNEASIDGYGLASGRENLS